MEHPDLRQIGFSIHETYRDAYILGQHYTRPSDDVKFERCPLGDNCLGFGVCAAKDVYGDQYKTCTAERCYCQAVATDNHLSDMSDEEFIERCRRMGVKRLSIGGPEID